jgi:hypothetical protein
MSYYDQFDSYYQNMLVARFHTCPQCGASDQTRVKDMENNSYWSCDVCHTGYVFHKEDLMRYWFTTTHQGREYEAVFSQDPRYDFVFQINLILPKSEEDSKYTWTEAKRRLLYQTSEKPDITPNNFHRKLLFYLTFS